MNDTISILNLTERNILEKSYTDIIATRKMCIGMAMTYLGKCRNKCGVQCSTMHRPTLACLQKIAVSLNCKKFSQLLLLLSLSVDICYTEHICAHTFTATS